MELSGASLAFGSLDATPRRRREHELRTKSLRLAAAEARLFKEEPLTQDNQGGHTVIILIRPVKSRWSEESGGRDFIRGPRGPRGSSPVSAADEGISRSDDVSSGVKPSPGSGADKWTRQLHPITPQKDLGM
ncbi:hypothetical protein FQN60_014332 [Etheostoma spectabile]|uniref:Uncharacterized protein n=1 Tax=Etheostoma spectabile TaxID=54343 RepID=A0A5J5D6R1_9PERO|nr:hypothetical protein FQN60_014332 [Etheostoma spectabile]